MSWVGSWILSGWVCSQPPWRLQRYARLFVLCHLLGVHCWTIVLCNLACLPCNHTAACLCCTLRCVLQQLCGQTFSGECVTQQAVLSFIVPLHSFSEAQMSAWNIITSKETRVCMTAKWLYSIQSHRDITTPDISTNTIWAHFFREPSQLHCKFPGYNHGRRSLQCHLLAVALNESDVDELLPKVTLADARHHAKMLAAFVAEHH